MIALVVVCAWAAVVPYAFELGVAARLEVLDHVVPAVAAMAGGIGHANGMRLAGATVVFLSGVFITATHLPLLWDASASQARALLHVSAGPPVLALGAWLVRRALQPA